MKFIKRRGQYWYKEGDYKQPFDKCECSKFKSKYAKKCFKCSGFKKDGTFKKKLAKDKKCKMNGYVYIFLPNHHKADWFGYVAEHLIVAEKKIGRKLRNNEQDFE